MGRRSLRMSLSVLGAALIASAVTVAVTPSVAAAALPAKCPFSNTLCLFDGTSFAGAAFNVSAWSPAGACVNLVQAMARATGPGRVSIPIAWRPGCTRAPTAPARPRRYPATAACRRCRPVPPTASSWPAPDYSLGGGLPRRPSWVAVRRSRGVSGPGPVERQRAAGSRIAATSTGRADQEPTIGGGLGSIVGRARPASAPVNRRRQQQRRQEHGGGDDAGVLDPRRRPQAATAQTTARAEASSTREAEAEGPPVGGRCRGEQVREHTPTVE